MPFKLVAEQEIIAGEPSVIQAAAPTPPFAVVFEDDGTTGYFYALDTSRAENPIVDALQIYNVANVTDGNMPSTVQLVWSSDGKKSGLLINRHPHAIFDFEVRRGYCRTGFPPPVKNGWSQHDHTWDPKLEELFQ